MFQKNIDGLSMSNLSDLGTRQVQIYFSDVRPKPPTLIAHAHARASQWMWSCGGVGPYGGEMAGAGGGA
jgi:hypothetical protein